MILMGDAAIRRYNRRFLRHDRATDVLAFPIEERGLLGEILVSVPTARRQAREAGHSLERELLLLATHGLLHLLGYDHERPAEAKRMWRKTERLLKRAGAVS